MLLQERLDLVQPFINTLIVHLCRTQNVTTNFIISFDETFCRKCQQPCRNRTPNKSMSSGAHDSETTANDQTDFPLLCDIRSLSRTPSASENDLQHPREEEKSFCVSVWCCAMVSAQQKIVDAYSFQLFRGIDRQPNWPEANNVQP